MHQPFLTVVVHVIIIDQCNQTAHLYEIQITVIYSRATVAVTSGFHVMRVICKTWTGIFANSTYSDQTSLNAASDQGLHGLLKLQEVKD